MCSEGARYGLSPAWGSVPLTLMACCSPPVVMPPPAMPPPAMPLPSPGMAGGMGGGMGGVPVGFGRHAGRVKMFNDEKVSTIRMQGALMFVSGAFEALHVSPALRVEPSRRTTEIRVHHRSGRLDLRRSGSPPPLPPLRC